MLPKFSLAAAVVEEAVGGEGRDIVGGLVRLETGGELLVAWGLLALLFLRRGQVVGEGGAFPEVSLSVPLEGTHLEIVDGRALDGVPAAVGARSGPSAAKVGVARDPKVAIAKGRDILLEGGALFIGKGR